MKYILLLFLVFSSHAFGQDNPYWCEQISPGQKGRPCDGKDPNGRGTDKDGKDKGDVVCFSYGTDTEGENGQAGTATDENTNNDNPLKSLGGCFQGLGTYFGGGQFAADFRNAPGGLSKGWKDFIDGAQDRVWKPFENSVNTLFGGGHSDNGDKQKAIEAESAALREFIAKREKDKDAVDAEVYRTAFQWKMSGDTTLALTTSIDKSANEYDGVIADLRVDSGIARDGSESVPFVEKNSDYPFETPMYTSAGSKLYQTQAYYNYAKGKVAEYTGPDLPMKQLALENADSFLSLSDRFFHAGDAMFGERSIAIARQAVDLSLGFTPGVSFGLDCYQLMFSRNFITGEEVTDTQKAIVVGALFAPAVISGSIEVVGKVAVKLANMAKKPAAQKLLKAIVKADEELAPLVGGKSPCISFNKRKRLHLYDRFQELLFPTAFACPHVGSITDELIEIAEKKGLTKNDEFVELANELPLVHQVPKSRLDHAISRHDINSVIQQAEYNSNFDKLLENQTFFNKDWGSDKIATAVEINHNRAMKSGLDLKGTSFESQVFGTKVTNGYGDDGLVKTAFGDFKYTRKELGL